MIWLKSHRNIDNRGHTKAAIEYIQSQRDSNTRIVIYPKFKILGLLLLQKVIPLRLNRARNHFVFIIMINDFYGTKKLY